MIRKISVDLVPLTPELAKTFSAMTALPGERDLKPGRLKFFEKHIKGRTFLSPTWSIAVVKGTEAEYRADGQHTSTTLARTPEAEFPVGLQVTIQRFEVDSPHGDGPGLFDMFDNPQSVRTNTEAMGITRAEFDDLQALDNAFLVKIANGIDYHMRILQEQQREHLQQPVIRFESRRHGNYFADEHFRHFAVWLSAWKTAKHCWMFSKPGIVAEMLDDWMLAPNLADEFWALVLTASHPDPNHETRDLADTMKDWTSRPKVKQDKFKARAQKVWNAFKRLAIAEKGKAA